MADQPPERLALNGAIYKLGTWRGEPCWVETRPGRPPKPFLRFTSDPAGVRRYLIANGAKPA